MLIQCCLLLLGLAQSTGNIEKNGLILGKHFDRSSSFSNWPSLHNGANMWSIRKREIGQGNGGPSEGVPSEGGNISNSQSPAPSIPTAKSSSVAVLNPSPAPTTGNSTAQDDKTKDQPKPKEDTKVTESVNQNKTDHTTVLLAHQDKEVTNTTVTQQTLDLSGPGVVKRGIIVFGGFALLAVAYFIFYRRKSSKNDAGSSHNANDANQFRYGVLQSDDRRDNLELSRIPLTMESDEDEDDDLEIFDLEQKRKSMSYVNLQVNDEEIVNGPPRNGSEGSDRDNLLLDIEDANSDALINWSNNGNKSIL